jgi:hypothetical protein
VVTYGKRETIRSIQRAMDSRGIRFEADHSSVMIEIDGVRLERPAQWLPEGVSTQQAGRWIDYPEGVMILGPRISTVVARRIREAGGWLADASGTTYVRAPGVLIDVVGRSHERSASNARGSNARNLMSAGRAQVVFCLLTWPSLVEEPVRFIADVAGVSPALVHTVVRLLEEEHYLSPPTRRLERRNELIDLWAAAFPLGLARALELGRFVGDPLPHAWPELGHRVYASGEFAAPSLSGPDLVLYVPALDTRAIAYSHWRRSEPVERANIIVRRRFWLPPGPDEPGIDRAPDLLLFGDLLASNDPRQREIAGELRGAL